jgi:phosphonate transport system permease protein
MKAALLSALVPGLGQLILGRRQRGLAILATGAALVVVMLWLRQPLGWLSVVPFWVVQVIDAMRLAGRRRTGTARLVLLGLLPFYVAGWQATEASPSLLVSGYPRVAPLLRSFLAPDFLTRESLEDMTVKVQVFTPCPEEMPPEAPLTDEAPSVSVRPACAPLGSSITVAGAGFAPDQPVDLVWRNPTGERSPLGHAVTGGDGAFAAEVVVPVESIPSHIRERYPDRPQDQAVEVTVPGPPGPLRPSETLRLVIGAMAVTIALGFIATVFGALLAVPLAVLGARNLMADLRFGRVIYFVVRTFMNVMRSIEPLILAVVFVVWVGQGPFAGALALTVHTVAALGKLFSESIEGIDEGPVEAVRATGASWLETVVFAVFPQVVPPFTAFTVYRWDINVRMSTILGFVGGGGIGFLLQQWIFKSRWSEAATAVVVIAMVVMFLDFLSATLRERIVEGKPLLPSRGRRVAAAALIVALLAFAAWAWRTAEVELGTLARGTPNVRPIVTQLLTPRLIDFEQQSETATATLVVPCPGEGSQQEAQPAQSDLGEEAGHALTLSQSCADPGDWITVTGQGLRPGASGQLAWLLPDGRQLTAKRVTVDDGGILEAEIEVRPILEEQALEFGAPVGLVANLSWDVGYPMPSTQLRITLSALIQTVLMALMATTVGALVAIPLSLLGARNIMPRNLLGNAVYYLTRTFMNVLRSVEPLILAAIFAAWVGYGIPFAGVMAITLVTIANLGKLFSEAVESIDPGPLEAVYATGANKLQVIVFGVLPQMIPPFLSFGIYQWDINVRISTVIGFVGGGGIGFVLRRWMNLTDWRAAAVAILGIVVVVSTMDFLSGLVRARIRHRKGGEDDMLEAAAEDPYTTVAIEGGA